MTVQYECATPKELRSVLSSNTVHLLWRRHTEIIVFEQRLVRRPSPNKQRCVYKERRLRLGGVTPPESASCLRWVGNLGELVLLSGAAHSMKGAVIETPLFPTLSPPTSAFFFLSSPSIALPLLLPSNSSAPSRPRRPPSLQPLQTTSCLC